MEEGEVASKLIVEYSNQEGKIRKAITGFSGYGLVAKQILDHIIGLGSELIAEIHSYRMPPVFLHRDGVGDNVSVKIYKYKDFALATSEIQPQTPKGQFSLTWELVSYLKKLGVQEIYSLAAYVGSGNEEWEVGIVTTEKELSEELREKGYKIVDEGSITGMNGLVLGVAKVLGMRGVCILSLAREPIRDFKSALRGLKTLQRVINEDLKIEKFEEEMKSEETSPEVT